MKGARSSDGWGSSVAHKRVRTSGASRERRQSVQEAIDAPFVERHGVRPRDVRVSEPVEDRDEVLHDGDPYP